MIITKARIDLATANKRDGKPILTNVHYNAEEGRLEACDGFVLASVPVELEEGESAGECLKDNRLLPVGAIRDAQKLAKAKGKSPSLKIEGDRVSASAIPAPGTDGETVEGETVDLPDIDYPYPDVDQIKPRLSGVTHLCTIDVKRLYNLCKAICEDPDNAATADLYVNLYQGEKTAPIVVEPLGDGSSYRNLNDKCRKDHRPSYNDGPLGLLMPLYHE